MVTSVFAYQAHLCFSPEPSQSAQTLLTFKYRDDASKVKKILEEHLTFQFPWESWEDRAGWRLSIEDRPWEDLTMKCDNPTGADSEIAQIALSRIQDLFPQSPMGKVIEQDGACSSHIQGVNLLTHGDGQRSFARLTNSLF